MARQNILVVTPEVLSATMAGPGIRAWHIAGVLAEHHDVHLASTNRADLAGDGFTVSHADEAGLRSLVHWCDVLLFQGWVLAGRSYMSTAGKVLVADLYDPMHLEQLEQARDAGSEARRATVRNTTAVLNDQLLRGDFFICASDDQRAFWLGHLAALGRVNPAVYDADETLRALIDVVPFGIDDEPPRRTGAGVKGVHDGIAHDDKLVLWGGGIYNWFDPLTLIDAVDGLRGRVPNVRLLFMGAQHPNPDLPTMRMPMRARRAAEERGLLDRHVFFNEGWVPYHERQNVLLDADVAVSIHLDHLETTFSYRSRVLDYLWAGLPVVSTTGDAVSSFVRDNGLGITVAPGDARALEAALATLLIDEEAATRCRENIARVTPELRWSVVAEPLVRFCEEPRRAPDLVDPAVAASLAEWPQVPDLGSGWRHDVRLIGRHLRDGGPALLARRVASRLRRARAARGPVT